jgi:hypothetical protein
MIGIFCQIDVEPLCVFSVEIIGGAKQLDTSNVVGSEVKFQDIEIVTNAKGGEDVLMLVELSECRFHRAKGCGGMNGVLCHVEEVEDGTDCSLG